MSFRASFEYLPLISGDRIGQCLGGFARYPWYRHSYSYLGYLLHSLLYREHHCWSIKCVATSTQVAV